MASSWGSPGGKQPPGGSKKSECSLEPRGFRLVLLCFSFFLVFYTSLTQLSIFHYITVFHSTISLLTASPNFSHGADPTLRLPAGNIPPWCRLTRVIPSREPLRLASCGRTRAEVEDQLSLSPVYKACSFAERVFRQA